MERDPEGRVPGRRAAGAPSRARQKLSERRGAEQPAGSDAEGPRGLWGPAESFFPKLGERTSAELSLHSLLNLPLLFFGIGRDALTKTSV